MIMLTAIVSGGSMSLRMKKVEVNPNYLDRISGVHERALRYKAEQIGKKRRGW